MFECPIYDILYYIRQNVTVSSALYCASVETAPTLLPTNGDYYYAYSKTEKTLARSAFRYVQLIDGAVLAGFTRQLERNFKTIRRGYESVVFYNGNAADALHCYGNYFSSGIFNISTITTGNSVKTERGFIMANFREFLTEEDGIGVVELILILVVLIGLVLIFKDSLRSLVEEIFETITQGASDVSAID